MNLTAVVESVARQLGVLGEGGQLVDPDSLILMEIVELLERETGLQIPASAMSASHFQSVASITALLAGLAERSPARSDSA